MMMMLGVASLFSVDPEWVPVVVFLARATDVSMGTIRLICVTRGRRAAAIILGFFEVLVWVLAVSGVLAHLDRWINVIAFAGGFAAGNAVGMWIEQRLAIGTQIITLFSRGRAQAVAERLRYSDLVVTTLMGSGRDGPVALCVLIVPRKRTASVISMAREIDPNVIATVEDARTTTARQPKYSTPGMLPTVFRRATTFLQSGRKRINGGTRRIPSGEATDTSRDESPPLKSI